MPFRSIHGKVQETINLNEQMVKQLEHLANGPHTFGGSIDETVRLAIHKGHGNATYDKTNTWWARVQGTFTIVAPPEGTWTIQVKDTVADKMIFNKRGLKANTPYAFGYKTGFQTQLHVNAVWSKSGDTKLAVKIHATY